MGARAESDRNSSYEAEDTTEMDQKKLLWLKSNVTQPARAAGFACAFCASDYSLRVMSDGAWRGCFGGSRTSSMPLRAGCVTVMAERMLMHGRERSELSRHVQI